MPRTMDPEREAYYRGRRGPTTAAILDELDAERRVSKQLEEAIQTIRILCDGLGHDNTMEALLVNKVDAECIRALAAYREGL